MPGSTRDSEAEYDYIVVVDAANDRSVTHVYRYKDTLPEQGLPELEFRDEWRHSAEPGISALIDTKSEKDVQRDVEASNGENQQLKQYIHHHILEFLNKTIPAEQIPRTPLFLHATGAVRSMSTSARHQLMREVCGELKSSSEFLISECKDHVYAINAELEAVLGWVSINYMHSQMKQSDLGLVDLVPSSLQLAYAPSNESKKSSLYKVSLGVQNKDNMYFDVDAKSDDKAGSQDALERYIKALSSKESDPCVAKGAPTFESAMHAGSGNQTECIASIKKLVDPKLKPAQNGSSFVGVNEMTTLLNGEQLTKACEWDWEALTSDPGFKDLSPEILRQQCFLGNYADLIVSEFIGNGKIQRETSQGWSLGRALVYATSDLNPKANPSGVQANVGSIKWQFGVEGSVTRPPLNNGNNTFVSRKYLGGAILLAGLFIVLYLLLGQQRRSLIAQTIRNKFRKNRYTALRDDDFELHNVPVDEFEIE